MLDNLLKPQHAEETDLTIECVPPRTRKHIRAHVQYCAEHNQPLPPDYILAHQPRITATIHTYTICKALTFFVPKHGKHVAYPYSIADNFYEPNAPELFPDKQEHAEWFMPENIERFFMAEHTYSFDDQGIKAVITAQCGSTVRTSSTRLFERGENMLRELTWTAFIPVHDSEHPTFEFVERQINTLPHNKEEAHTILKFIPEEKKYQASATLIRTTATKKTRLLFDTTGKLKNARCNGKMISHNAIPTCFGLRSEHILDYEAMLQAFTRIAASKAPEKIQEPQTVFPLLRYQSAQL
ncbi:MAG: hypothetical protein Q7K43_01685 [Candidatus Woesearchaeota archaeon]|nr:hypothetical protein [Candidatus Woesearchaeota archaeon]